VKSPEPSQERERRPERRRYVGPHPFIVPRRRLRFVRDSDGRVRILEETGY
jgi:hypothetical protein